MKKRKKVFDLIYKNKDKIRKLGVKRIGIFGSYVKSNFNKDSDIDLLVEFDKKNKTFDNYMGLKLFFENELDRKVDIVLQNTIKARIKPTILKETVYARL